MQRMSAVIAILIALVPSLYAEWTVVQTFPIPESASGLAWDGEYLYCGIYGADGGHIYRINPENGDYQLIFTGPQGDAFGLTYDGDYLWTTDHTISINDPAFAMQLDWNGDVLRQFDLPDHYMSGIAYDAGDFWVSTYYDPDGHIYKVDSEGTILQDFPAPDRQPWDLCLENGFLWMADYWGDTLYKMDPTNGQLLESYPSEGVDPAGIVFDGQYMWYCDNGQGFNQDYLYKVDLGGSGTPVITLSFESYDFGNRIIGGTYQTPLTITNSGSGDLEITAITASQPQYSTDFSDPILLPPDESTAIQIDFTPDQYGALPALLTIESNDPLNPVTSVNLNGFGIYPAAEIRVNPPALEYANIRNGAYTARRVQLENQGAEPLVIDQLELDNSHFTLDSQTELPLILATRETAPVRLWFHAETVGSFSGTLSIFSNDADENPVTVDLAATVVAVPVDMGTEYWHLRSNMAGEKIVAMKNFVDLTGDGVAEVLVADNEYHLHCVNGNASGLADIIWTFSSAIPEIGFGSIYQEQGLFVAGDLNGDTVPDVVIGTAWGSRSVFALDGLSGEMLWVYDTHQFGEGGWVYQVNAAYDFNGDSVPDVLAATGDDGSGTGPKSVFCIDGTTGDLIWQNERNMAQASVTPVGDIDDDGIPEVVAGGSANSGNARITLIRGSTGNYIWGFDAGTAAVFALIDIADANGDGQGDFVYGTFNGRIRARSSTNEPIWSYNLGTALITRFDKAVAPDGTEFILPSLTGRSLFPLINAQTGQAAWTFGTGGYILDSSAIPDINGDGHFDVLIGTLNNQMYVLSGIDGTPLYVINHDQPVDQTLALDDVDGSGTPEMALGDRHGWVRTYATGGQTIDVAMEPVMATVPENPAITNYPNPFNPVTTFRYDLPAASPTTLKVYDLNGRLVEILLDEYQPAGQYQLLWDASYLSSGIYLYRLEQGQRILGTGRTVLLK
ncbi:MAG: choice-of-anchor D domain-containing protein [Gemmatimonadetes bacterium]|nr:MAG: choice-of-anchor D domain-containing protein [Gemmatimonadota bacterium]